MTSKNTTARLLWVDLETTGLDPQADPILEIGAILTTGEPPFAELGRFAGVAGAALPPGWQARMSAEVVAMHTANGLLADVAGSCVGVSILERGVLDLLDEHAADAPVMLAGSGVASFDQRFIAAQMPRLAQRLVFSVLDVGVVRRALRFAGRRDLIPTEGDASRKPHRALDDVTLHLAEWRRYAELLESIPV